MSSPDPDFWQTAAKWMWGALLIPLGIVWKRIENAPSKEDIRKLDADLETHRKEDRENFIKLFENAEADRTMVRDGFDRISTEMHAMENRLRDRIDAK